MSSTVLRSFSSNRARLRVTERIRTILGEKLCTLHIHNRNKGIGGGLRLEEWLCPTFVVGYGLGSAERKGIKSREEAWMERTHILDIQLNKTETGPEGEMRKNGSVGSLCFIWLLWLVLNWS